jgi:hypothetical protein
MRKVVSAKARENYRLELVFDDGSSRLFDATPYLEKGIFVELKDPEYFRKFRLAFGTVQWANEQDFASETLYAESELLELKK